MLGLGELFNEGRLLKRYNDDFDCMYLTMKRLSPFVDKRRYGFLQQGLRRGMFFENVVQNMIRNIFLDISTGWTAGQKHPCRRDSRDVR